MGNWLIPDGGGYIQDEPETSFSAKVKERAKKDGGWQKRITHMRQTEEAPDGWS